MSLSDAGTVLLHNPRCSKSRAAKAWLEEQGHTFVERLYLQEPLTTAELAELRELLGEPPREWVRSGQDEYATAGLSANSSDVEHYAAMAAAPILLERPIVIHGGAAAVGRPLERVVELFEED
jgi:arsenate reductase